ncbi:MAG: adenine nucleotide alpha hydrolase [Hyphomicrobiales bacterium]|nr:MAG: adenine nucleotide alpha hydrolase [Hyphomicrobiales bacterium]
MKTLLSWSTGKDSAWALHLLRRSGVEVAGLFTTVNSAFERVAMHAVRQELVTAQAASAGLPLEEIPIPYPCSNADYERIMGDFVALARAAGVTHMAFGDLFLTDIRHYREERLADTGITPIFPVWGIPTDTLARDMIAAGHKARITCLDPGKVPERFAGEEFAALVDAALPGVDPCGENGEFHTFCYASPAFARPIPVIKGEVVTRDGFVFTDFALQDAARP